MMKGFSARQIFSILIALAGFGIVFYYDYCESTCAFLKGTIVGIDLKYVGIAFMLAVILLVLFRQDLLLAMFVALGVGTEIFLIAFQVRNATYCSYCLAFGALVIALFCLHFSWKKRFLLLACAIMGLLFFLLFFEGSVIPTYGFAAIMKSIQDISMS